MAASNRWRWLSSATWLLISAGIAYPQPSASYLDRWLNSVQEESRLTRDQLSELEEQIDEARKEQRARDEEQTKEITTLKGWAKIAAFLLGTAVASMGGVFAWLWNRRGVA